MTEYIDIVNEYNVVVAKGERDIVHKSKLLHRSVHIFVFNLKGELFLQKRSLKKKEHPGKYDSSAAGHLDSSESYYNAAKRELKEELSIKAPLKKVMEVAACSETDNEFVNFYTALGDSKIIIDTDEIQEGRFYSIKEIKNMISKDKSAFTPAFLLLFNSYFDMT